MQPLWCNAAALTVALIFYLWRSHHHFVLRRRRVLRERVAYMLWMMADKVEGRSQTEPTIRAHGAH
jgi:hypothetical protein